MKKLFNFLIVLIFIFLPELSFCKSFINDDLKKSLESLYEKNPKIKYHINILKSKDELMPQAFSEFRPEIKG